MSNDAQSLGERYIAVQESQEFGQLRRTFRRFVFPITAFFLAWYFLYVLLSMYAPGFMGTKVLGNINIGLLLGSDRQRGTLALVAGLLALQVGISATLVSQLGTDGAALAFLAINVVSGIASTLCVWRWFMRGARLGQAILPPLAAGAVLLGLALLGQPVAALIAFAAIGGIVALGLPLPAYRETAPA